MRQEDDGREGKGGQSANLMYKALVSLCLKLYDSWCKDCSYTAIAITTELSQLYLYGGKFTMVVGNSNKARLLVVRNRRSRAVANNIELNGVFINSDIGAQPTVNSS
ncbi:hypothetical protein J6590_020548 [Homalodisca vitripennis]|nr:hypothetical protein J6590_020548 [Homalodisca vitripennis]